MPLNAVSTHYKVERISLKQRKEVVGARGFEPRTSCAQGRRATRLRYAPTEN